ncbi:unnamed protein product [Adineta ricciae]|uniref:Uncharacterized protein n=1 Tax=Adineta ricciae TaxID=249248 RepID=A0A815SF53_ADIRI|nr:unnamed protein product [Adineta ricciae]CAF1625944.1 unnamed protein product [Adineta ricciae]
MTTDNSNNNINLDSICEELINNTEFRQQYDQSYLQQTTTGIETTSITTTNNNKKNDSSIETTPNSLDIAYLQDSHAIEKNSSLPSSQSQSQTTIQVSSCLHNILDTITVRSSETITSSLSTGQITFQTVSTTTTGTVQNRPTQILTVNMPDETPSRKSTGTLSMTPIGHKSVGTMPRTPPSFKTTSIQSETPTTIPSKLLQTALHSPTIHIDIGSLKPEEMIVTIHNTSTTTPNHSNTIN